MSHDTQTCRRSFSFKAHSGAYGASQPGLVPEAVYPGRVLEPPPADMLVIGPRNRPLAMIEAPAMGPFMGARAVTSRGLGPWLLLDRPHDDPLALVQHPAFLPPNPPRARHGVI